MKVFYNLAFYFMFFIYIVDVFLYFNTFDQSLRYHIFFEFAFLMFIYVSSKNKDEEEEQEE
jgi:hypothetical protein